MQDEVKEVWTKFLREGLMRATGDELTMLDELGNGRNDPAEVMNQIFYAIENEMNRRLGR